MLSALSYSSKHQLSKQLVRSELCAMLALWNSKTIPLGPCALCTMRHALCPLLLTRNSQPLPRLPNGIYFSVYSIGVKCPIVFNRGVTRNPLPYACPVECEAYSSGALCPISCP